MFDLVTKGHIAVTGKKCGLAFVTWHFISALSYCIDAIMVCVAVSSGGNYPLVLAVGLIINFVTFLLTLLAYDWFQQTKGIDLFAIEDIKKSRCGAWITQKGARWTFWLGSFHVLEPDVVTLLVRKQPAFTWSDVIHILIPSTLIHTLYWSIYWYTGAELLQLVYGILN